jgi:hypothetical protein
MRFLNQPAASNPLLPTVLLALAGAPFVGPLAVRAAPNEPVSVTVSLDYQETAEPLVVRSVSFKLEPAPFRKEPAVSKTNVFRGLLEWELSPAPPVPFLWDRPQGRLHLDLNRNRDFTDDANGSFGSGTNGAYQVFTNIPLPRLTAVGVHPVLVQLDFRSYEPARLYVSAGLCSYWQANISLRGQPWQFGLVEDVLEGKASIAPQHLLLRPWAERGRPFNLRSSSPDFFDYSTRLFFGRQAYGLECRFDTRGAAPRYLAMLTEQAPRLGDLQVTGAFLHRLILKEHQGLIAVLDQPQGSVKLPVGKYELEEIWLRTGDVEALRLKAGRITVDPQRPTRLAAGGPLTNSVKVHSEGLNLNINYELLGVDGQTYRLPRPDYENPPEFAVFQGTNRLAADKFKYG